MELLGVSVKECGNSGLSVGCGASAKATQCEFSENTTTGATMFDGSKGIFTDCSFHHNEGSGVFAQKEGTLVEFRGEQTEIHHNGRDGLVSQFNATINIYIPSRTITALVHDQGSDPRTSDLWTCDGGKIRSQLSSSSLELTIIHEAAPEGDD